MESDLIFGWNLARHFYLDFLPAPKRVLFDGPSCLLRRTQLPFSFPPVGVYISFLLLSANGYGVPSLSGGNTEDQHVVCFTPNLLHRKQVGRLTPTPTRWSSSTPSGTRRNYIYTIIWDTFHECVLYVSGHQYHHHGFRRLISIWGRLQATSNNTPLPPLLLGGNFRPPTDSERTYSPHLHSATCPPCQEDPMNKAIRTASLSLPSITTGTSFLLNQWRSSAFLTIFGFIVTW